MPEPGPPGDRGWQHPSEVGLAVRGRHDRKRSARLAAGVVLGGIGILVTGVLLGSMDGRGDVTPTTTPVDGASRSVAHVSVVEGERTSTVTGVVVDAEGHVLVPAAAVADADEIWVRCHDGMSERTSVLGQDPGTGLAVLRLERPAGEPAVDVDDRPEVGTEVVTMHARGGKGVSVRNGVVEPIGAVLLAARPTPTLRAEVETDPVGDEPASAVQDGGVVFDRSGRWVGMTGGVVDGTTDSATESVEVVPATQALRVAQRLIDAA